jgi:hypothetical protein
VQTKGPRQVEQDERPRKEERAGKSSHPNITETITSGLAMNNGNVHGTKSAKNEGNNGRRPERRNIGN